MTDSSLMTVSTFLVSQFQKFGVECAFGISGGAIATFWNALEENPEIKVLHFRDEAGAAFAATEASLAKNKPVVVFITTGPGIANVITGIEASLSEGAKVIFVSASTSASERGKGACQETTPHKGLISGAFASNLPGYCAMSLEKVDELPEIVRQLDKGLSQPGGFVAHLSIPVNIQSALVDNPQEVFEGLKSSQIPIVDHKEVISKCAKLLLENPFVIWIGFGARLAAKEILELAEKTGAKVMSSPRGKGIFPEDHSQYLGVTGFAGHESVLDYMEKTKSPYILVLGSKLGEFTSFWSSKMIPTEGFIHVDINPNVPGRAYPETKTLAIQSDIGVFVRELTKLMPEKTEETKYFQSEYDSLEKDSVLTQGKIRPEFLMRQIQQVIVENVSNLILMAEPGNSFAWAIHHLQFTKPIFRTSTSFASMGHFVAGSVGAAAMGEKKVVVIAGDGSMLMNGSEINTAVRYQIPVVWIVLNDGQYNMVKQVLPNMKNCESLVNIPQVNFQQFAKSLGADGIQIKEEFFLKQALEKALKAEGPFIVDVIIDPSCQAPVGGRMNSLVNQASSLVEAFQLKQAKTFESNFIHKI